ncbi:unnamed protein product [Cladocopium goreaui]|uniref:Ankyrin repeat protein RF_0580 n=1 Tax=Cladocopium goreaui TaxID=2562237 RepID=A0A9P1DTX5_9DINO|nr:unnamed protein product [Cladocopium goreaui]
METGGLEAFARSSGFRDKGYLKSLGEGSVVQLHDFQLHFQSDQDDRFKKGMSRTVLSHSVPTLGSRQVFKASTHKFPPTWHVRSTPSLAPLEKSGYSYTKSADDAKEKQLEAACKKLWVAVHGAEYEICQLVRDEQKEGGANQAMLGRLNKSMGNFPSIQKALKAGAKIDWHNPEWDGATLLIRAARTSSMELAVLCLALYGPKGSANMQEKDNMGRGVQHWASLCGAVKLMEYLLTAYPELDLALPDSAGDSPLHLAAYNGHLGTVRLLLRQGVKETPNALGFSPTQLAESRRMWHVCRFLREYQSGEGVKDRERPQGEGKKHRSATCHLNHDQNMS